MHDADLIERLALDSEALSLANGALSGLGLTPLVACRLGRTVDLLETPEAVEEALREKLSDLRAGWVRRESWAGRVDRAPGDPGRRTGGVLLEGEWALTPDRSLSLLYDGCRWRLLTFTESAGEGAPALRENVRLIGRDGDDLRYAVYWGAPAELADPVDGADAASPSAIRRFAARLTGIGEVTL